MMEVVYKENRGVVKQNKKEKNRRQKEYLSMLSRQEGEGGGGRKRIDDGE
jgi:hypothetical protein